MRCDLMFRPGCALVIQRFTSPARRTPPPPAQPLARGRPIPDTHPPGVPQQRPQPPRAPRARPASSARPPTHLSGAAHCECAVSHLESVEPRTRDVGDGRVLVHHEPVAADSIGGRARAGLDRSIGLLGRVAGLPLHSGVDCTAMS